MGLQDVVAATVSPSLGCRAVYLEAQFLVKGSRGKGLAAAVEAAFVTGRRPGLDAVWGHIQAGDLSSLCTVRRLGRQPVQEESLVELPAR